MPTGSVCVANDGNATVPAAVGAADVDNSTAEPSNVDDAEYQHLKSVKSPVENVPALAAVTPESGVGSEETVITYCCSTTLLWAS